MKFAAAALVSLGLSGAHALVDIPAVSSVVSSALSEFSIYVTHALDPTAAATSTSAKATDKAEIQARGAVSDPAYWLANIGHHGIAAFNSNPSSYTVFRNVKDYGAKGDGVTDDTAAINAAISAGGRIGPANGQTSTITPAIVYFPSGTYIVSSSIIDYYFTQLIGNPNDLPVLKASANFPATWIIDGDQYESTGNQGWGSTNVFYRQVRNLVLDLTAVPPTVGATGIHWPTAQATSLQNVKILMSSASGTQHQGVFIENGSGGFMSDVTTDGGAYGLNIGSQQFTMRGLTISNAVVGINQIWNWGWTYQGLSINNCGTAISIGNGGINNQAVGSVVILDSTIQNTPKFVDTAYTSSTFSNGSLWLENIQLSNVANAVVDNGATALAGSSGAMTISGWGQGHSYTPGSNGPQKFQGSMAPASRPSALLASGTSNYYTQSKPQYEASPVASFLSVRSAGAKGDGQTDDTAALNAALQSAAASNQILYIDQGTYVVSDTVMVPAGSRIVGETYPVILATGSNFANINSPKAVVQVGNVGDSGLFQWSDTIVGTRGSTPGAILVEWNLAATAGSGIWDVHARIGGFDGSNLQVQQCPTTAGVSSACEAAYMTFWVRSSAKNVYLENVWLWTADHDMDSPANTQISVYTGRGLLVEGSNVWLYGTAVEHHSLYQYQFSGASNIVAGFIQTETPYWQPNPDAAHGPYPVNSALRDPVYTGGDAYGLRILDTQQISIYGAGLYSFFNNYVGTCSAYPTPENCQAAIFSIEGSTSNLKVFALSTVGTINQVIQDGAILALASDNLAAYAETICYLAPAAGTASNSTTTSMTTSMSSTKASTTLATSVSSKSATSTAPATTGWTLLGCYTDNVSGRALPSGIPAPGGASKMTVEACQAGCQALGFTLAGVEYGDECYCGNQVENGGGPAPDGNAQCTMACSGDSTETCGGPNRLDMYTYGGQTATTPATTTAMMTTTASSTVSTVSATATSGASGWILLGCYTDNVSGRALPSGIPAPGGASKMTVEACQAGCQALGFTLAGVEYGDECYCGNQVENGGGPAPDGNAQCTMACSGDSTETCGGPNRLDMYTYGGQTATTASSTVSTVSATATSGASGWVSLGCYTDNVSGRALPSGIPAPGGASTMTVEVCQAGCQALGFTLAGVEYGDECYCGNQVENGGGPAPDGNTLCNMACSGAPTETCGGPNRLNLYQYTTSSASVAKRGLAYNNNNPQGNAIYTTFFAGYSKISWGYDWGFPSAGLSSSWEFVPMLWGLPSGSDPAWTSAVQTAGTKHILGFNEPDLTYSGSANIAPAAAAQGYQTYMQPFAGSVKIGMPSVLWNNVGSSSGGNYNSKQWTEYFLGNCTGCTLDFASIHWYQDCNPTWFKGNVTDAYATLNLPIWVTEFQCYGTDAQQVAFLQDVLPWMDSQPYVDRYAYFGVFPGYLVTTNDTGLSDIGKAYASA